MDKALATHGHGGFSVVRVGQVVPMYNRDGNISGYRAQVVVTVGRPFIPDPAAIVCKTIDIKSWNKEAANLLSALSMDASSMMPLTLMPAVGTFPSSYVATTPPTGVVEFKRRYTTLDAVAKGAATTGSGIALGFTVVAYVITVVYDDNILTVKVLDNTDDGSGPKTINCICNDKDFAAKIGEVSATNDVFVELRDIAVDAKAKPNMLSVHQRNIRIMPKSFDFDSHAYAVNNGTI